MQGHQRETSADTRKFANPLRYFVALPRVPSSVKQFRCTSLSSLAACPESALVEGTPVNKSSLKF